MAPDPTPDNAPDGFWEDFGKFVASKSGIFEKFLEEKNNAPAPDPVDPPADPPTPPKKKGWFND